MVVRKTALTELAPNLTVAAVGKEKVVTLEGNTGRGVVATPRARKNRLIVTAG
jgi:hypothetical protein